MTLLIKKFVSILITYRPGALARSGGETLAVFGMRFVAQAGFLYLLARFLGPGQFGEYAAITSLAVILGALSSLGIGFVVLGDTAQSAPQARELLSSVIPVTIFATLALFPIYLWVSWVALGSTANTTVLVLIGITELLLMPVLQVRAQYLQGLGRVALGQFILIIPIFVRFILVLGLVEFIPGAGLTAYALIHFFSATTTLVAGIRLTTSRAGTLVWHNSVTRALLRRSAPYAVMRFTALGPAELDKVVALRLLSHHDAGLYALAARGLAIVTLPVVALTMAAQPKLFREFTTIGEQMHRLVTALLLISLIYGVAAALFLHFMAPAILEWVFGDDYTGVGSRIALLAWAAPFIGLRFAAGGILITCYRPMLRSTIECLGIVILLAVGISLARAQGFSGLIYGVIASEAAMAIFLVTAVWKYMSHQDGSRNRRQT